MINAIFSVIDVIVIVCLSNSIMKLSTWSTILYNKNLVSKNIWYLWAILIYCNFSADSIADLFVNKTFLSRHSDLKCICAYFQWMYFYVILQLYLLRNIYSVSFVYLMWTIYFIILLCIHNIYVVPKSLKWNLCILNK